MLYTPHTRVFLSAVPVYAGSSLRGFIEVEDHASAARAWLFAEREQRRAEAPAIVARPGGFGRLWPFARAARVPAA
jgi:hypothetical protein